MADSELSDLYVTLSAVNAPMLAAFAEAATAGEEMVTSITASLASLQAELAGVGGEFSALTAGMADVGAASATATGEVGALSAEVKSLDAVTTASAGEIQASFAAINAELAKTTAGMTTLSEEDQALVAKMQADNTALAASVGEAAKGQAALGDAMAGTTAKAAEANTTLGMSNTALVGVGAAAIGAAYESVKMAGDFQAAITRLNTSAGESQQNLKMVGDGILAMAGQVGYSSDQLATAMYKVESGGQHGAAGLATLQAAAQGAKAENADLTTVADALTSAMVDYKIPADEAATTTSKLVAATSQGKMTFEELAGSLSAILPIASANHVSLNDILGDLASMTVHGMSAQQATQNLADTVRQLAAPNAAAAKELASLGLNATEVSKDLGQEGLSGTINEISQRIQSQMGPDGLVVVNLTNALKTLPPAVQDLGQKVLDGTTSLASFTAQAKTLDVVSAKQATSFATLVGSMHGIGTEAKSGAEVYQTYSGALKKAMGDATAMNTALMIGGENAGVTANAIKVVSGATVDASGNVQGFAEVQQTFNQKMAEAKDAVGALMISIGEKLLPVVTAIAGAFATAATWMAQHQAVAVALATVIGGALVLAFTALTYAAAKWVTASIAGFASDMAKGAEWVVAKIAQFTGVAVASEAEAGATAAAWAVADGAALLATGAIILAIGAVIAIGYLLITHWQTVKDVASAVWNFIVGVFNTVKNAVVGALSAISDAVMGGPAKWGQLLGQGVGILAKAGKDLVEGLWNAWVAGWKLEWHLITDIPGLLTSFFSNAPHWLYEAGSFIISGLWDGFKAGWQLEWSIITAIPGLLISFFSNAPTWLYNAGADILTGLWNGFTSVVSSVISGIGDFITNFIHGFEQGFGIASPSTVMMGIGSDIIQGLWNGVVATWNSFWGYITGLPATIIGFFANSGSWLVSAGTNIVQGLWNGISSGWSWLTSQVSSLASSLLSAAKSALGISSPSKLFADEVGAWIGPGLAQGITANAGHAVDAARDLAARVTAAAMGATGNTGFTVDGGGIAGTGASGITTAAAVQAAGSTGQVVNVHLNVAGHVWTTQDLVTEIQQQLVRHNIRNPTNATNYAFA